MSTRPYSLSTYSLTHHRTRTTAHAPPHTHTQHQLKCSEAVVWRTDLSDGSFHLFVLRHIAGDGHVLSALLAPSPKHSSETHMRAPACVACCVALRVALRAVLWCGVRQTSTAGRPAATLTNSASFLLNTAGIDELFIYLFIYL
jgi:hypothetical protein